MTMTTATELTPLLKRLKLGAILKHVAREDRREELDHASFLQVILADEVNRRHAGSQGGSMILATTGT